MAGNSSALESLETTFGQDLNGDGTIGIPKVIIQTDGTTALTEVGSNFFLNNTSSGTGPELMLNGAGVTPAVLGAWTPIGAVQVAGGDYDIAFHNSSSGLYTVWSTDSNGNYLSNIIGAVAGNSSALESLETTFGQDLNGDGHIGVPSGTSPVASSTATVSATANSVPDNFHFASDGSGTPHVITFSLHPGNATGQTETAPNGTSSMAGHDVFVFALNSGLVNGANFTSVMDAAYAGNTALNNIDAALAEAYDGSGNAVATNAGHAAQFWAHHDFHFI